MARENTEAEMVNRRLLAWMKEEAEFLEQRAKLIRQHAAVLETKIDHKWGRAPELHEL